MRYFSKHLSSLLFYPLPYPHPLTCIGCPKGRYSSDFESKVIDLEPFTLAQKEFFKNVDWAVCAFGKDETDCLLKALSLGGKARVGFENNLYNRDGSLAKNNAERVAEIVNFSKNLTLSSSKG